MFPHISPAPYPVKNRGMTNSEIDGKVLCADWKRRETGKTDSPRCFIYSRPAYVGVQSEPRTRVDSVVEPGANTARVPSVKSPLSIDASLMERRRVASDRELRGLAGLD